MLDAFFNKAGGNLRHVLRVACEEATAQKHPQIGTEHLLLAILREPVDLASRGLASMKIDASNTKVEADQYWRGRETAESEPTLGTRYSKQALGRLCLGAEVLSQQIVLSETAVQALLKAEDYARYLGQSEISCAHLLLGILDMPKAAATIIFEQFAANLTFLRRQVLHLLAQEGAACNKVANLKTAIIGGLKELVDKHESSLVLVDKLSEKSGVNVRRLPNRGEILHMVCIGYLADFLCTQVVFQRYLLEETLLLLSARVGNLNQEIWAEIVESGAKNLRADVRSTVEFLWSHEYRHIGQMLDEAEYDVICSVIEDLWWAQSEEIVLDQSYAAALEDHRRSQILSLQKRRIEVTQRLSKLSERLDQTIRQTFERRSLPA
jgi:hypothetical protein